MYGIVDQAGGDVRIRSQPGEGTVVELNLPATDRPPEAPFATRSVESSENRWSFATWSNVDVHHVTSCPALARRSASMPTRMSRRPGDVGNCSASSVSQIRTVR